MMNNVQETHSSDKTDDEQCSRNTLIWQKMVMNNVQETHSSDKNDDEQCLRNTLLDKNDKHH